MTKRDLTLHLLREAGSEGITTAQLMAAGVGSRYGARLKELKEQGHRIKSERLTQSKWRYTLTDPAEAVQHPPPPVPGPSQAGLFSPPAQNAALTDWEAA